ncbi:MAG: AAA family ATPase [Planctomycetota bacterium]
MSGFVRIDRLELELGPGLNVLSGGSGEGKTLLLEALRFALGEGGSGASAGRRWVAPRAAAAEVEAELLLGSAQSARLAAELGCPPPADGRWRLSRRLTRSGAGRCTINDERASRASLRAFGARAVECFGQGFAARLREPEAQRALLDGRLPSVSGTAPDADYARARAELLARAHEHDRLLAEEQSLREGWAELAREREVLLELDPEEGEYEGLRAQLERLEARAEHATALAALDAELSGDEGARGGGCGLVDGLHQAAGRLERLVEAWPELEAAVEALLEGAERAQDAAHRVAGARESEDFDPRALEELRARERSYRTLARRLGVTPEALATRWRSLQEGDPDALAARRERLHHHLGREAEQLLRLGQALSAARAVAGHELSVLVTAELAGLGLPEADFRVELSSASARAQAARPPARGGPCAEVLGRAFPEGGLDELRFAFYPDGPPASPDAECSGGASVGRSAGVAVGAREEGDLRWASGGELGRVALALGLHGTSPDAGAALLVFDEVDQNVGARLGAAVGRCMAGIARDRQVLAVTHLAPVAAHAARHLRARKLEGSSSVDVLADDEQRIEELALMIRGEPLTEASLAQARELLAETRAVAGVTSSQDREVAPTRAAPEAARSSRRAKSPSGPEEPTRAGRGQPPAVRPAARGRRGAKRRASVA